MSCDSLISVLHQCHAVIFDLDGVIADTEPLKFAAYQAVFRETYGVELPAEDITWRGMKEQSVIAYWFDKFQLTGEPEKLIQAKRAAYQSFLEEGRVTAVSGVIEFIHWLQSVEKLRGVATSSSRREATMVLENLGLTTAFSQLVTRDDVQQLKPHPEVYLSAASALGVQPSTCVAFEDSQSGVSAAKSSGIFCVGVLTSFSSDALAHADQTIANFTELSEDQVLTCEH
ncbi:MAG TPA: HAD family hydrolase [Elainellaceae cyanobacterium]